MDVVLSAGAAREDVPQLRHLSYLNGGQPSASVGRRWSSLSGKSRQSSETSNSPPNFLSSFRRLASSLRISFGSNELYKKPSGPCSAFADWPIPRYPDDYEWDD